MSSPSPDLTPGQQRVLDFILDFQKREGLTPTHAEIARGLGFRSINAASEHVRRLRRKGVIDYSSGLARSIRVMAAGAPPSAPRGLPLIGAVAAGQPLLAEENIETHLDLDPALFRPRADYLLRVRGDSMIEAGIRPDDLVAVHRQRDIRDGQVAVIRLGDEVTLKRWRRRGDKVFLEPANRHLSPIEVDLRTQDVAVEGLLVGLLRLGMDA